MEKQKAANQTEILRLLPSVESLLNSETSRQIISETGAEHLSKLARTAVNSLRIEIQTNEHKLKTEDYSREKFLGKAEKKLESVWRKEKNLKLRKIINATGVVIHTNLGRAPLSENARKALVEEASGYCSLEYDVETGKRGKRGGYAEKILAELTSAESALIVNNCAAAAVLVLTALCKDGEAIISRGELVEIGGDFRVPDVMEQSGAILKEVGTTNRTKVSDYENAVTKQTKMLVKVHPSNYRIIGFTSVPTVRELAKTASRNEIIFYEDAGSGAIFDLSKYGLNDEPIIKKSIADGADIVTFSADKLLGAAQAGLIVGKKEYIETLRKHPLYRVLRVSKLIYAALEATLEAFRRESQFEEIPVLQMLSTSRGELKQRTERFAAKLKNKLGENSKLNFEIIEGNSVIGGGSAPAVHPLTTLLSVWHKELSANILEKNLRRSNPPVATRILEDKVLIDLRTVAEKEETELLKILSKI